MPVILKLSGDSRSPFIGSPCQSNNLNKLLLRKCQPLFQFSIKLRFLSEIDRYMQERTGGSKQHTLRTKYLHAMLDQRQNIIEVRTPDITAIDQAKRSRTAILAFMQTVIDSPRGQLSEFAPRIETIQINPEKIGLVIGPGGKNIKSIVAETGAEINIEDDGRVKIYSTNGDAMERAKEIIMGMVGDIEVGKIYRGRVVTLKDFGAFVEVLPGKDGLVHISEWTDTRVNRMDDVAKVGDEVWVKCIGQDDKGRSKLSRKAAMKERSEAGQSQQ